MAWTQRIAAVLLLFLLLIKGYEHRCSPELGCRSDRESITCGCIEVVPQRQAAPGAPAGVKGARRSARKLAARTRKHCLSGLTWRWRLARASESSQVPHLHPGRGCPGGSAAAGARSLLLMAAG